ncbi:MAG: ArsR/SmtB family transcription factor [Rhodospirillales bacterium]
MTGRSTTATKAMGKTMRHAHDNAKRAATFLKALANENRLVILCALAESEKNVGELEGILGIRQPTLSQQLARLRADNLVATRRQSKQIFYRLANDEAKLVIALVLELLGPGDAQASKARRSPATGAEAA